MAIWAGTYLGLGVFVTFEEALYFSIASFTTAGYGDLVPPVKWRLLGASEAMVGFVLLGWSVGLVLVLLERMNRRVLEED
jgi:voltage-gated potassium channel Kch